MSYDPSNDSGICVPVFDPKKFCLYTAKMRSVTAMEGFGKALDMKFKTKLPAKEHDVLRESDAGEKA